MRQRSRVGRRTPTEPREFEISWAVRRLRTKKGRGDQLLGLRAQVPPVRRRPLLLLGGARLLHGHERLTVRRDRVAILGEPREAPRAGDGAAVLAIDFHFLAGGDGLDLLL